MRKRQKTEKLKSSSERIADYVDIPKDILPNCPKITAYNDNQLMVENYRGILEYTNEKIRIKAGSRILCICGLSLSICAVTDCDIMIEGKFDSVRWE